MKKTTIPRILPLLAISRGRQPLFGASPTDNKDSARSETKGITLEELQRKFKIS
jgi:hypothetical protein